MFQVKRKKISFTGTVSLGWHLGQGYVTRRLTAKDERWAVCDGKNRTVATCPNEAMAHRISKALNNEERL